MKSPFWRVMVCGVLLAAPGGVAASPFGEQPETAPTARQYPPDREYQVRHLALDVTPDFRKRTISGTATIDFEPNARALREMRLDAVDLRIESIESPQKIETWQTTTNQLIITFAQAVAAGKSSSITVRYSAEPSEGIYFRTPELGYNPADESFFSQGEAIEARHWYPCFDSPNEKFTSEITCHVAPGMIVLSNGRLDSEEKETNGLVAFHWRQDLPQANYLVSLDAGYFNKWEDHHGNIPLPVYTPPSDHGDVALTFRDTRDIMDFYEKEIGVPFPWVKYGQVVVHDFVASGMENTSLTTLTDWTLHTKASENLTDSDPLIAHEMAHQWFGDLVTCKDWSHIWLNEGFATFYASLYDEHKNGADAGLYGAYHSAKGIIMHSGDNRPIVDRKYNDPDEQFDYRAYPKGAFVLRMLRAQLGVPLYRDCIKTYLLRHKYGNVETEDLRRVIEEKSGETFERFFDQWLYHGHFPELDVRYSWDEKTRLAKISVWQTQPVNDQVLLFDFPLTVAFHGKNESTERTVRVNQSYEDFYLPLAVAPRTVVIDPHMALLAKIDFPDFTAEMAREALKDRSDVVGRLRAVEFLSDRSDHLAVALLKKSLQEDRFWGVRLDAADALAAIHNDESLAALLDSQKQRDPRVRRKVMACIGQFYDARAFAAEQKALQTEKDPEIRATEIEALGISNASDLHPTLVAWLRTPSYHDRLADAAIEAMRTQHDPYYILPLIDTLKTNENVFASRTFGAGLETVASLAHDEKDKDAARELIESYVNAPKVDIEKSAVHALGVLGDARAIAVLDTFAGAGPEDPRQKLASQALEAIRSERAPAENLKELRTAVTDLQKQNRQLRDEVESLRKEFEAQQKTRNASRH